jgi:hypothetical protein
MREFAEIVWKALIAIVGTNTRNALAMRRSSVRRSA